MVNKKVPSFDDHVNESKFNKKVLISSRDIVDEFKKFMVSTKTDFKYTFYLKVFDNVEVNITFLKRVIEYAVDIDAYTDFDNDDLVTVVGAEITVNPIFYPEAMNEFISEVKDMLRHEFEHTTQNDNAFKSHKIKDYKHATTDGYRAYMLSKPEFPAFMHGFHAAAKTRKVSMNTVIIEFLESRKEWFYGNDKEFEETKEILIRRGMKFLPRAKWD